MNNEIKSRSTVAYELGVLCFETYVTDNLKANDNDDETAGFDSLFYAIGCIPFEELLDGFVSAGYNVTENKSLINNLFAEIKDLMSDSKYSTFQFIFKHIW